MSKKLYLSFLWHMHQPYYKNDATDSTLMPWVFLHAIKDYYDMPWYLSKYPSIKATFNLVPSLLEQINAYIDGTANDKFLETLRKEVSQLEAKEITLLEEYLFLSNSEQMIKPLKRYHELYQHYTADEKSLKKFSQQEIQDTQVLFLLSWCGNYLRHESDLIQALIVQGEAFTHTQKTALLETLFAFIREIIPYYKALMRLEQVALSTTPFYHPILPLLLNRQSAQEARLDVTLPTTKADYTDFAHLQLQSAVKYFEETFNQKPNGMWPSEGSVSQQTAETMSAYDIQWICSDEEILFKTLKSHDRKNLYRPYTLQHPNGESINIFFRDRYLSDRIGFEYSKQPAKEAAQDFINHLKHIHESSEESSLVPVILDGENAWEFYANNAQDFFDEFYRLLQENTSWCETILFDDIDQTENLSKKTLNHLAAGSWINGNFDIWIGHHEKNAAWELLDEAKLLYDKRHKGFDSDQLAKIDKEFMIALGSDWFWWYGDDHYTSLKAQFDEEFRGHICNIYQLMGKEPPHKLSVPIVTASEKVETFLSQPTSTITPIIDGKVNDFYEWLGSGFIDLKKELTTMDRSLAIEALNYGSDLDKSIYFLFRVKNPTSLAHNKKLKIYLNENTYEVAIQTHIVQSFDDELTIELGVDEVIEMKVKGLDSETFNFAFELLGQEGITLQRFPTHKRFELHFNHHALKRWNFSAGESQSEFRYCKLTKEWTLFSPERLKRPDDTNQQTKEKQTSTRTDSCPFDRGNESLTPKEIARIENHEGWQCRVVPNLYNALSIDGTPLSIKESFFDKFTGFGAHEVLIETPKHDKQIWNYSIDNFYNYFSLLQQRVMSLHKDQRLACLSIFKNHGAGAGASLTHAHTQLIAMPFLSKKFHDEINHKQEYFKSHRRALMDDMVYEEKMYDNNLVAENSEFIIYCPYASKFAFEAKIVAKQPLSSLSEFTAKDIISLSEIIQTFFTQFHNVLGDIPFNMIIKNAPYENYDEKTKEYFRFHINILPRIYKSAGFELDSDIYINLILPEHAAQIYKENL